MGLPFPSQSKDDYLVLIDAHIDTGSVGAGGIQDQNDAVHIKPKSNTEYITLYAPIKGKISRIEYKTMLNEIDKPKNYAVSVSIAVRLGVEVNFHIENYSNDPDVEKLQKELMFIKKGQKVEKGDRLWTDINNTAGASASISAGVVRRFFFARYA